MGEQELAAFMGAEFIMGTAMDNQRLQPVQQARGPTATGKLHQLARSRASSTRPPIYLPPATPSTGSTMMIAVLADKPGVYEA